MNIAEFEKKLITSRFSSRMERLTQALAVDGDQSSLYVVGGTVRDAYLNLPSDDIDLASPLVPDELARRLERSGLRVIPTGMKHQTVTVLWEDGSTAEITTFRGEGISPREQVVQGKSIIEDLLLRDFTVNALAYGIHNRKLLDPARGIGDLNNRIIRAVGDPNARFREDPLRILRMVRLASTLSFGIDVETYAAAKRNVALLSTVSVERIREEFNKILLSATPSMGLRLFADLRILESHFPELEACVDFEQNRFHNADVFEHTLQVVDSVRPELVLRLAALFHDVGKPPTLSIGSDDGDRHFYRHEVIGAELTEVALKRLRYSNEVTHDVSELVRLHMRPTNAGTGGLRRLLRDTGPLFELWRELKDADARACKLPGEDVDALMHEFDEALAEIRRGPSVSPLANLAIRGRDILAAGYAEGPEIGEVLRALHELVLDDPALNTRETLLALLPKAFSAVRTAAAEKR